MQTFAVENADVFVGDGGASPGAFVATKPRRDTFLTPNHVVFV